MPKRNRIFLSVPCFVPERNLVIPVGYSVKGTKNKKLSVIVMYKKIKDVFLEKMKNLKFNVLE